MTIFPSLNSIVAFTIDIAKQNYTDTNWFKKLKSRKRFIIW